MSEYINVTELEEKIRDNEYEIICGEDFPHYSYGVTTEDFIELINDCERGDER